jgi:protein required for attachment to host cells
MTLWILIANAAGARVAEVHNRKDSPQLIHRIDHAKGRAKAIDLVTDRPGRVRDGSGSDAMGPRTGPKEVETEEFARHVTVFLHKEFNAHHFDALAILAPASFLGLLRADLPADLAKAVVFEEAKDLANVHDSQLAPQLIKAVDESSRESFARTAAG